MCEARTLRRERGAELWRGWSQRTTEGSASLYEPLCGIGASVGSVHLSCPQGRCDAWCGADMKLATKEPVYRTGVGRAGSTWLSEICYFSFVAILQRLVALRSGPAGPERSGVVISIFT